MIIIFQNKIFIKIINFKYKIYLYLKQLYINIFIMGCDYYIEKDLVIYYNDNNYISSINLSSERGYFYDINYDEDEEDYEKKYNESINKQLKPSMTPIIIYIDNNFNNESLEKKYKKIIEDELKKDNKKWESIKKIMKEEHRYERE
jgi:hypothetical protein